MKAFLIQKAVFLALVAVVFFGSFNLTYAQLTPEQAANAEELRAYVLGQVGNPVEVSGLTYCNEPNFLERNLDIARTCGGVAEATSFLDSYKDVTFSAGDTVKCYFPAGARGPSCVVTSSDRTTQRFYNDSLLEGKGVVTADMQGNIIAFNGLSFTEEIVEDTTAPLVDLAENAASAALSAAAIFILTLANLLLGIAGTLFNWVVVKTVFQFSTLIGNSPGLLIAWGILRDLGNMLLLFGFIFIGIATILNLSTYTAKKTLPLLIIFAVLMNFSLFAAEAVIDVSNGLSSMLYTQANTDACLELTGSVDARSGGPSQEDCAVNYGIAGHIMQATGLSSIFGSDDSQINITKSKDAAVLVGLALFATIGAVVLFAASIMLMVRAVTLTLLMVTAPIGFAGMAIPPLQKAAKDWWHQLLNQSFFAPILLLLIFISLKITDSFAGGTNSSLAGALTNQNSSVMGVIMVFFLVIGFLIASLIAAKKIGAVGAGFAVKSAGWATAGGIGFAGRQTAGRSMNFLDSTLRSSKLGQTRLGRRVAAVTSYGAKSSFDLRGTKAAGALGKQVGDLGKTHEGGYKDGIEKKRDSYAKYADSLKQTGEAKEREREFEDRKVLIENSKKQETKLWQQQEESLKNEVAEKQVSIRTAKQVRDQALAAQMQKVIDASSAAGAATDSAQRKTLDEAENQERLALNTMIEEHRTLADQEKEGVSSAQDRLNEARKAHKKNMEGFDAEIEKVNKEILGVDKNSSKRNFAENIDKPGRLARFTGSHNARIAGAAKIRENLKKTKLEKDLEAIKTAAEKGGEAKDELKKVEGMLEENKEKDKGGS